MSAAIFVAGMTLDEFVATLRGVGVSRVELDPHGTICALELGHAPAAAQSFVERVQARFPGVPVHVSDIGAVLAVHVGPGALGLMTYRP